MAKHPLKLAKTLLLLANKLAWGKATPEGNLHIVRAVWKRSNAWFHDHILEPLAHWIKNALYFFKRTKVVVKKKSVEDHSAEDHSVEDHSVKDHLAEDHSVEELRKQISKAFGTRMWSRSCLSQRLSTARALLRLFRAKGRLEKKDFPLFLNVLRSCSLSQDGTILDRRGDVFGLTENKQKRNLYLKRRWEKREKASRACPGKTPRTFSRGHVFGSCGIGPLALRPLDHHAVDVKGTPRHTPFVGKHLATWKNALASVFISRGRSHVRTLRGYSHGKNAFAYERFRISPSRACAPMFEDMQENRDDIPTPPWATHALVEMLKKEGLYCPTDRVWDPAAGRGHTAAVLSKYYTEVRSSDLWDYGKECVLEGIERLDFLKDGGSRNVDWIISHPPFGKILDFWRLS